MSAGSTREWIPALIASGAAAAVVYAVLKQAEWAMRDADADDQALEARKPLHGDRSQPIRASIGSSSSRSSSRSSSSNSGSSTGGSSKPVPASRAAAADDAADAVAEGSEAPKECAFCHKAPQDQDSLHRCSRCKHAWYCNQACQRAAWPQHKKSCGCLSAKAGSSSSSNSSSSSAAGSPTAAQQNGAAAALNGAAAEHNTGGSQQQQASAVSDTATMMDVLKHYLTQHASSQDDPLQQQFEQAVLLYVRAEHRTAVAQLQAVKQAAEQQGQLALAGDACKWLGHAYSKLGDGGKAAASFAGGCELAEKADNKKLQVDCLAGMGAMYRDAGQLAAAEGFLRRALAVSDSLGDEAVRAASLTHLGTVLIASDAPAAIVHLEEAVQLREDQVIRLHDAGQRGSSLATAIMEHAGSLVSLAGAYYCCQRYGDAADAYSKSLAVFEMIDDVEKMCKCLINLANLYELQMDASDGRSAAAQQRQRLYRLAQEQLGRDVPGTCSICCEPINPLQPTVGEDEQLLLLSCLHCFHHKCWEAWSEKQSTCPSCKQPMPLAQQRSSS